MCGITEEELRTNFAEEIKVVADRQKITEEECLEKLKMQYDGYHFHPEAKGVYNPFSLLKALFSKDFGSYWFETGTPTFLVKSLKQLQFDVRSFTDKTIFAEDSVLKDYTGDGADPVQLLYQTGYLTITDYDSKRRRYVLGFPNEEVKYGFLGSRMPGIATCPGHLELPKDFL